MVDVIHKIFERNDAIGSGKMSRTDLMRVFEEISHPEKLDVHSLFEYVVVDANDAIDTVVFLGWLFGAEQIYPKTVTGKAMHLQKDLEGIGKLVHDVMQDRGWASAALDTVAVKRCPGGGPFGACYRVTAPMCAPADVAFRLRWRESGHNKYDPLFEQRYFAAAKLLSACGVAPSWLAEGEDWFIEVWEGQPIGHYGGRELYEGTSPEEVGSLLAQVHQTPCDWFEKWRRQFRKRSEVWRRIPDDSHYWHPPSDEPRADQLQVFSANTSPAAARVVTCHGDFHTGNILRSETGLKVIDMEYTFAGPAVFDLCCACQNFLLETSMQRAFVRSYLKAFGDDGSVEQVDAVLVDIHAYGSFLELHQL